jgi:hypothetical protein
MNKTYYEIQDFSIFNKDNIKEVIFEVAGIKIETSFNRDEIENIYAQGYICKQSFNNKEIVFEPEYRIVDLIFVARKDFSIIPKEKLEWMVTRFEANEDYLMTIKLLNDELYTFQISTPQIKSIKTLHCITLTDTSGGKRFVAEARKHNYDSSKMEVIFK